MQQKRQKDEACWSKESAKQPAFGITKAELVTWRYVECQPRAEPGRGPHQAGAVRTARSGGTQVPTRAGPALVGKEVAGPTCVRANVRQEPPWSCCFDIFPCTRCPGSPPSRPVDLLGVLHDVLVHLWAAPRAAL